MQVRIFSALVVALAGALTGGWQHAAAHRASAPVYDPCGFRGLAWPYVQFSATIINRVWTNTDSITSADTAYLKQALRDAMLDMGKDFGVSGPSLKLRYDLGVVMQRLRDALVGWESSASSGFQTLDGKIVDQARASQGAAWQVISSVCPGGGKSTSAGPVLRIYDWVSRSLPSVALKSPWAVQYNYDCRNNGENSNYFLLTVRTGNNALVATLANEVAESGSGSQTVRKTGKFYLKIDSDCYWHIRLIKSAT